MVYIASTNVDEDRICDIPGMDGEFRIITSNDELLILLTSGADSDDCESIFIDSTLDWNMPSTFRAVVQKKISYFSNIFELEGQLRGKDSIKSFSESGGEENENAEEENSNTVLSGKFDDLIQKNTRTIDTNMPEDFLSGGFSDIDPERYLQSQLSEREKEIEQLKGTLTDKETEYSSSLETIETNYKYTLKKVSEENSKLTSELTELREKFMTDFAKRAMLYGLNPTRAIMEKWPSNKTKGNVSVISSVSLDDMLFFSHTLSTLLKRKSGYLVLDVSLERVYNTSLGIPSSKFLQFSDLISDRAFEPEHVGSSLVLGVQLFQDLGMLSIDWGSVITRLERCAEGKPIVILLGCLNSFAMRHAFAVLSSGMQSFVMAQCSPHSIMALTGYIGMFTKENVTKYVFCKYIEEIEGSKNLRTAIGNIFGDRALIFDDKSNGEIFANALFDNFRL